MKFNLKKDLPMILIAAALVYIIDYVILSPLGMLPSAEFAIDLVSVSYTHLRAHET